MNFNTDLKLEKIILAVIIIILLSFIVCTFDPPKINYFKDPVTNKYGINAK